MYPKTKKLKLTSQVLLLNLPSDLCPPSELDWADRQVGEPHRRQRRALSLLISLSLGVDSKSDLFSCLFLLLLLLLLFSKYLGEWAYCYSLISYTLFFFFLFHSHCHCVIPFIMIFFLKFFLFLV